MARHIFYSVILEKLLAWAGGTYGVAEAEYRRLIG